MRLVWPKVVKGGSAPLQGILKSDNSTPASVWSSATVVLAKPTVEVALRYIPDSVKLLTSGAADGSSLPVKDLFSEQGALVGCDAPDGLIAGQVCSGSVSVDLVADFADFGVQGWLAPIGYDNYSNEASVHPGGEVKVKAKYVNLGSMRQNNVVIALDELPPGVTVVPGTTFFSNANTGPIWERLPNDNMRPSGINFGNYAPRGGFYVKFTVRVGDLEQLQKLDPEFPSKGTIKLAPIRVSANTNNGSKTDSNTLEDPTVLVVNVYGPLQELPSEG